MAKKVKSGALTKLGNSIFFGARERKHMYRFFFQEFSAGSNITTAEDNYLMLLKDTGRKDLYRKLSRVFKLEREGEKLGVAFGDLVPYDEASLLNAGSMSGDLTECFNMLQSIADGKNDAGILPIIALAYPLLGIWLALRTWYSTGETLAQLERTVLNGAELEGLLGLLVAYHDVAAFATTLAVIVIGVLISALVYSFSNWSSNSRTKVDKLFPYNIYRGYQSAQFLLTLASLRKGGVSEQDALKQIEAHSGPWLRYRIQSIRSAMERKGISFGQAALDCGFHIPDIEQTITIASMKNTSKFGDQLLGLAQAAHKTALAQTKLTFSALFFLLMAIGMGLQVVAPMALNGLQAQIEMNR